MKKMTRFISALVAFVPALAVAANMVTYTATSKISQKDADKKAMEGVAMQVSSAVKSSMETHTTEDAAGNVQSTFESRKSVFSNVLLKGAKIVAAPVKDGVYQSTITVDLDQLASKILVDIEQMRIQMNSKDSVIRLDMLDRDYRKVAKDMVLLEKMAGDYNDLLEDLSFVQAVPKNLRLESTLAELTEFMTANLSSVKMETNLTKETLVVTVVDFVGPIADFPIAITQDHKNLATAKTNNKGKAVFSLKDVMKKKPSGEVIVHADMNFKFVRQSSLLTKTVAYQAKKTGCAYQLTCSGDVAECGALQVFLMDAGIAISDDSSLPMLSATLSFTDKPNSGRTLYTSRGTIAMKAGSTELVEQPQGVGSDAEAAHVKAVSKLSVNKVLDAFGKGCKK